jgi:hypothetical protein
VRPSKALSLAACAVALTLVGRLPAQTATDDNFGSRLETDPGTGAFLYSWWGASGQTYFIQHSEDLAQWNFLPIIEQGFDDITRYGFMPSAGWTKFFVRLRRTDQATGGDPYTADFDADGIPNGWEVEHGLDPFDPADASTVVSGLSSLELYQQSLGDGADPVTMNSVGLMVYSP